jgi:hypothetical protein
LACGDLRLMIVDVPWRADEGEAPPHRHLG